MTLRRVKPPGPGDPLGIRSWPRRPSIGWLLLALMGVAIDPNSVLSPPRDADRGRRISYAGSASSCQGCHSIEGRGTEVGPDLSKIGAKYANFSSRAALDSRTGRPSFWRPITADRLDTAPNYAKGEAGAEVMCHDCGDDLGRALTDGPPPTGLRFRLFSAAPKFVGSRNGHSSSLIGS